MAADWRQACAAPRLRDTRPARAAPGRRIDLVDVDGAGWVTAHADGQPAGERILAADGWPLPDGSGFIVHRTDPADELGGLAVIGWHGGDEQPLMPGAPGVELRGLDIADSGRAVAFAGVTQQGYELTVLHSEGDRWSQPRVLLRTEREVWFPTLSPDGRWCAVGVGPDDHGPRRFGLRVIDTRDGSVVATVDPGEGTVEPVAWDPAGSQLLCAVDEQGWLRPGIFDLASHKLVAARIDAGADGVRNTEIVPLDWSPDGHQILCCAGGPTGQRLQLWSPAPLQLVHDHGRHGTVLSPPFRVPRFEASGDVLAIAEDEHRPPYLIRLSRNGDVTPLTDGADATDAAAGSDDTAASASWRSSYVSIADTQTGLEQPTVPEVQYWLRVPESKPEHHGRGYPLVVDLHGGPHVASLPTFRPEVDAWTEAGYAWCSINFRGSAGFGRAYQRAIWADPGRAELADLDAVVHQLADTSVIDPTRVIVSGASYGGYLALQAAVTRSDRLAGAISIVGIADWERTYTDESPALRIADAARFGGPPEANPALWRDRSPVHKVADLAVPVLIVHARQDPRAPGGQMAEFVDRACAHGCDVDAIWLGAGHGAAGGDMAELIEAQVRFADRACAAVTG